MSSFKDIDNLMQKYITMDPTGVAVSIAHKGEVIYENYYGYSDFEKTKPVTKDTMYRVYSMTKPVSALCGMIAYERGVFLMDDPVSEYLPEYKNMKVRVKKDDGTWDVEDCKQPILMKHLFNMAVGFLSRDDSPTTIEMKRIHDELGGQKFCGKYDHLTEMRALAQVPMTFEPGTHWQYGYGLDIMAAVVEATSGQTLGEFMQENIFDPLDMKDTGYFFKNDWESRLMDAVSTDKDGNKIKKEITIDGPINICHQPNQIYTSAQTGLLSTLGDYQKFTSMLACGGTLNGVKIVGRKTIDMMRQNLLNDTQMKEFTNPNLQGYGYGYGVRTLLDPKAAHTNSSVGEFGWSGAAGTWMAADPSEEFSIVFMQQVMPIMQTQERYYQHRLKAAAYGLL